MSEIVVLSTRVSEETRDRFALLRELPENRDDFGNPKTESEMLRLLVLRELGRALAAGKIPPRAD